MIKPFKNRKLDRTKPVNVYRCLNRKGVTFSLKQDEHVRAHGNEFSVKDVTLHVSQAGKRRCQTAKQRNVHAVVRGNLDATDYIGIDPRFAHRLRYDPYSSLGFQCKVNSTWKECIAGDSVVFLKDGVWIKNPVFI